MSSAILYLAIVAIWAVVLIPRWLRRPHATAPAADAPAEETGQATPDADAAQAQPGTAATGPEAAGLAAGDAASPAGAWHPDETGAASTAEPLTAVGQHPRRPAAARAAATVSPAARRARTLRARRRMLLTLTLLAAGSAVLAVTRLTAWWACLPPAVMLGCFLLLLRYAARIDAQRAAARAGHLPAGRTSPFAGGQRPEAYRPPAQRHPAAGTAAPGPAGGVYPAAGTGGASGDLAGGEAGSGLPAGPGAEVIDISARIGDQLYDQYTDAEARAIGD